MFYVNSKKTAKKKKKKNSRRHFYNINLFFPEKQALTFHANSMKCQSLFSGKNKRRKKKKKKKKKITDLSPAEFAIEW